MHQGSEGYGDQRRQQNNEAACRERKCGRRTGRPILVTRQQELNEIPYTKHAAFGDLREGQEEDTFKFQSLFAFLQSMTVSFEFQWLVSGTQPLNMVLRGTLERTASINGGY
jgi:hypothetical protein